jgi:hypothetical protein
MNTELEEIRERMDQATAGIAVPSGLARRAARRRRRRILTRATAAAATAAVVAGVAIAATTAAPRAGGTIAAARLVSDIRSALDTATTGNDIVYVRALNGSQERWYYVGGQEVLRRGESFSAPGQPSLDNGSTVTSAGITFTVVDYKTKTWSIMRERGDFKIPPPLRQTSCATPFTLMGLHIMEDPGTLAANIREALGCGELTSEGTENVNGVDAIKLVSVRTLPTTGGAAKIVLTTTFWVNPGTYLPVRWQPSIKSLSDGRTVLGGVSYDVSWLPPTTANLASFRVPIPPGFTQKSGWAGLITRS